MNQLPESLALTLNEVHIWRTALIVLPRQEAEFASYLSPDEIVRADRFQFPIHRKRFIVARGFLRKCLSIYLQILPSEIHFSYSHRGKPFLENSDLQFNVSHSHDMAVYAFTKNHPIGIDVEKVKDKFDAGVAERFFSAEEFSELSKLNEEERVVAFYRVWSRKEALIKVSGEGLAFNLASFSVPVADSLDRFEIEFNGEAGWWLQSFVVDGGYQAAFAIRQEVKNVRFMTN